MGPRCSSAETQVCHRSYIIAANHLCIIVTCLKTRERNPFWDSKPELFSDIACLRILYQPCIVLFRNFFSGTPASNQRELRLHLNVVSTGAGVFKSRHILLHTYVNRIMITYLWRQIQLIIPSGRFRSIAILTCFENMSRDRFFHYVV
jgi:hypothetical protein